MLLLQNGKNITITRRGTLWVGNAINWFLFFCRNLQVEKLMSLTNAQSQMFNVRNAIKSSAKFKRITVTFRTYTGRYRFQSTSVRCARPLSCQLSINSNSTGDCATKKHEINRSSVKSVENYALVSRVTRYINCSMIQETLPQAQAKKLWLKDSTKDKESPFASCVEKTLILPLDTACINETCIVLVKQKANRSNVMFALKSVPQNDPFLTTWEILIVFRKLLAMFAAKCSELKYCWKSTWCIMTKQSEYSDAICVLKNRDTLRTLLWSATNVAIKAQEIFTVTWNRVMPLTLPTISWKFTNLTSMLWKPNE